MGCGDYREYKHTSHNKRSWYYAFLWLAFSVAEDETGDDVSLVLTLVECMLEGGNVLIP